MLGLPKFILKQKVGRIIINKFYPETRQLIFFKSGRSALSAIFSALSQKESQPCILIPDYICNVVHKAAKHANVEYLEFPTDQLYRPHLDEIVRIIKTRKVHAVLLASIFGTQNNKKGLIKKIRQTDDGIIIILDECQNLIQNNHLYLGTNTIVVGSFNLKNIYGVMGGFVGFKYIDLALTKPGAPFIAQVKEEIYMVGVFLKQFLKWIREFAKGVHEDGNVSGGTPGAEYSYCNRNLPYRVGIMPITKISLVRALQQLRHIDRIERVRISLFNRYKKMVKKISNVQIIETERVELSPYIPVQIENKTDTDKFSLKGPYAVETNPDVSMRPHNFAIFNNGNFINS